VIITVTPNPSVDRTIFIDALPRGQVIRSQRAHSEPSGKGVNVALALNAHGHHVLAVLPVGGPGGTQITEMLTAAGLAHLAVPIAGDIRSNVSLVEPDGTVTKVNEAGPSLSAAEIARLAEAVFQDVADTTWVAGCGSLPVTACDDLYASLTAEGRRRGLKVAIDTSGSALCRALPHRPDLIKPNAEELAEVVERDLLTLGDVVDAAQLLRERGAQAVLASLGPDGAVLVDANGAVHGEAPATHVVSAVGAGDALLAGFLAAGGSGPDALRSGLSWAAAAVQQAGTLYARDGVAVRTEIHVEIDRERLLQHPPRSANHA
jgi:1-phosphofructokinase